MAPHCLAVRLLATTLALAGQTEIHSSSAPTNELVSPQFRVNVDGRGIPVYTAKVAPSDPVRRWKAMDDKAHSADFYETASFATFDMAGSVQVEIQCAETVKSARVLPTSAAIQATASNRTISFRLKKPQPVTVEINGNWVGALHLFGNPPEPPPPPASTNVLYFGPGVHEVSHVVVRSGQTVYLAPGAIVRGIIRDDEPYQISGYSGLRVYAPTFLLQGTNITFRGRGILDGSRSTTHARHLIEVRGHNISLEGIILRDSSTWTIPIRQSSHVRVQNVKLLGYRANSDGIDICNSQDVTVEDCFIRTLDDLVVVKTDERQGTAERIRVQRCVLWNEVAHALSIGAELRQPVSDVRFQDCDIIHDLGREWTLRVFHCDAAPIRDVLFEDLRIEESPRLISLWIGQAVWTRDRERGHIANVAFRHLQVATATPRIELRGFDADHQVEKVLFDDIAINGTSLRREQVSTNAFVHQVEVRP